MNAITGRIFFTIIFLITVFIPATAQKKSLQGNIKDKVNQQPIGMASIRNMINGTTVISKQDGSFIIDVTAGNILSFSANGYYTDTISISTVNALPNGLQIKLRPLPSTLENVTVTSSYNRYQNDSIERRRQFLQTVGENKINAIGHTNSEKDFGIAINLDHFKKSEKNKRSARTLFDITEEEAYINYRWNESVVEKYTSYSNDELISFVQKSRPAYEWLRKHLTEEDLLYYINSQLKKNRKG
ncbi:hypothetical protein BH10BAC3_BH10BAC3_34640 [soil metagenome]